MNEDKEVLAAKLRQMQVTATENGAPAADIPYQGNITPRESDVVSQWEPAPFAVRLVKFAMLMMGAGLFFGIPYLFGVLLEISWLKTAGYVLGGLGVLLSFFQVVVAKIAKCPYCDEYMGTTVDSDIDATDEDRHVPCEHCFEYVLSHKGTLRALRPEDARGHKAFEAPLFVGARWPNECITCGAETTRHGSASKHHLELGHLLLGSISVSKAAIDGVPYCDDHDDAVSLKVRDEKLFLVFPTLQQQRRYLCVNDKGPTAKLES